MDKYKVIENSKNRPGNELTFFQTVTIQGKFGKVKTVLVDCSQPKIPVGTTFKVYETAASQSVVQLRVAVSYKVNGKRFVNIYRRPITQSAIKEFWEDLSFWDRFCLHSDIKQALRQRGISPALNRNSNLQLFLNRSR